MKPETKPKTLTFTYFDGTRDRTVDPFPLVRRLMLHADAVEEDGRLVSLAGQTTSTLLKEADVFEALSRIAAVSREVFDVKPYQCGDDGREEGLTECQCFELLSEFMAFTDSVKKNGPKPPECAPSTESATSERESATKPDSGSCSTPKPQPSKRQKRS